MATASVLEVSNRGVEFGQAKLVVNRDDIWFQDIDRDLVAIRVVVRNQGEQDSLPTDLVIEAAPLGAFVASSPLVRLPVPAIEAGDSLELSAQAVRPRVQPLGDPQEVAPQSLLEALLAPSPSQDPPRRGWAARVATGLLPGGRRRAGAPRNVEAPTLPPDPLELLGRRNQYWAGNLNVFVGRSAVERHVAQALRIYPGRTNLAMFVVGTTPDAHAFELRGNGIAWQPAIFDCTSWSCLASGRRAAGAAPLSQWVPTHGSHLFLLAVEPPAGCEQGELEVHVTQRSSGKKAVVEFSFDPRAAGPGCYTV